VIRVEITVYLAGDGKSLASKVVYINVVTLSNEVIRIACVTNQEGRCTVVLPLEPQDVVSVHAYFPGDDTYSPAEANLVVGRCIGSTAGFIRSVVVVKKCCVQ
jgi:hypothetical protein